MIHVEVGNEHRRDIVHFHACGEFREIGQSLLRILPHERAAVQEHVLVTDGHEKAALADTLPSSQNRQVDGSLVHCKWGKCRIGMSEVITVMIFGREVVISEAMNGMDVVIHETSN